MVNLEREWKTTQTKLNLIENVKKKKFLHTLSISLCITPHPQKFKNPPYLNICTTNVLMSIKVRVVGRVQYIRLASNSIHQLARIIPFAVMLIYLK